MSDGSLVSDRERALEAEIQARVSALVARLRSAGVRVGLGDLLTAHAGLAAIERPRGDDYYHVLRATLCKSRDDVRIFDRVRSLSETPRSEAETADAPDGMMGSSKSPDRPREQERAAWSPKEHLEHRDFADMTPEEEAEARRLLERLPQRSAARRSPRRRSQRIVRRPPHGRLDLRRIIRSSVRRGGDPLERWWSVPTRRPRPLTLVCDVSGSMEPYARMFLAYLGAEVRSSLEVEAFLFSTRLRRVTNELRRNRRIDSALAEAGGGGGTRIGSALSALNRGRQPHVRLGSIVVILSDGWDRGDLDRLNDELDRLRRVSHSIVWINPRSGQEDFAPIAGGMRTAMSHIDALLAGNTVRSLEGLATALRSTGP